MEKIENNAKKENNNFPTFKQIVKMLNCTEIKYQVSRQTKDKKLDMTGRLN